MENKNPKGITNILLGVVIILLLGVLGGVAYLIASDKIIINSKSGTNSSDNSSNEKGSVGNTDDREEQNSLGKIEGSLQYPIDDMAGPELRVCAQNKVTDVLTCTKTISAPGQNAQYPDYSLSVTEGKYYVYAILESFKSKDLQSYSISGSDVKLIGTRGYYSTTAICLKNNECGIAGSDDNTVREVEVKQGKTTTGIDPIDWYYDDDISR